MAVLTFDNVEYIVDHAVKGPDYVHGYDSNGICICSIEGISDFSVVAYDGVYLTPEVCFAEACNELRHVNGKLILRDGTVLSARCVGAASKTVISVDATGGAKSIGLTPENTNTEWRYVYANGISSLAISKTGTFTADTEAYYSVVFKSSEGATDIVDNVGACFTGDDCANGAFMPASGKVYDVGIYWNGIGWQAIVRGV
jgi:hypothetical protein